MHLKLSQKQQFKKQQRQSAIGNKIANKIMKVSRSSPKSNSETITNEHDKEIPKERYMSPEEKQIIIDDLRLIV